MGLQSAANSAGEAGLLIRVRDLQKGVGVGNETLRSVLAEQQRSNALTAQLVAATQETNQHLRFLINALIQAGAIRAQ